MVDSIHAARWTSQFDPSEVQFTLFPSGPNRRVHPIFKDLRLPIVPFGGLLSIPLWVADRIFDDRIRGLLLRRAIKRIKPDFIHALELQHAGYVTSRALEDKKIDTAFIATNYGSDIYWFQQFPKHIIKIKRILTRADRYSAECHRDVALARKYGFTGAVMPVFPNAGGFTEDNMRRDFLPTSKRKLIAIKGYEGWVGRAAVAIQALELLSDDLLSYKIVFYSCNLKTISLLRKMRKKTKLDVTWYAKGKLTHQQMLQIFSQTKVSVGVSLSDGISTSSLEAIAMRALPIQTSSSCLNEWLEHPSHSLITSIEPSTVARTIKDAINLTNIDAVVASNYEAAYTKMQSSIIESASRQFYV